MLRRLQRLSLILIYSKSWIQSSEIKINLRKSRCMGYYQLNIGKKVLSNLLLAAFFQSVSGELQAKRVDSLKTIHVPRGIIKLTLK